MKLWKKRENNLDEMKEQELLHIEKNCFWMLYFLLGISMIVQLCMGRPVTEIAGEWICFMAVSLYLVISCIRRGIWDRHFRPDRKTNLLFSVLAAVLVAGIQAVLWFRNLYPHYGMMQLILVMVIPGILSFGACLFLLTISATICRKRSRDLEQEGQDDN